MTPDLSSVKGFISVIYLVVCIHKYSLDKDYDNRSV